MNWSFASEEYHAKDIKRKEIYMELFPEVYIKKNTKRNKWFQIWDVKFEIVYTNRKREKVYPIFLNK